jgi:hypothetical protein
LYQLDNYNYAIKVKLTCSPSSMSQHQVKPITIIKLLVLAFSLFVGIDFIYSHTFLWHHDVCSLQPCMVIQWKQQAGHDIRTLDYISNLKHFHSWMYNFSSRCTHFYGTCPSKVCTHSTPDVTHKLREVWNKIYTQISTFGGRAKKKRKMQVKLNPTIW